MSRHVLLLAAALVTSFAQQPETKVTRPPAGPPAKIASSELKEFEALPEERKKLDDPSLKNLQPGDLLFWAGTYTPTDGRTVNITHIALFLGHEKKDGLAVMINATDGRTYRGKRANGFGVYDFRLPHDNNRSVFMGFGTPVGVAEMAK